MKKQFSALAAALLAVSIVLPAAFCAGREKSEDKRTSSALAEQIIKDAEISKKNITVDNSSPAMVKFTSECAVCKKPIEWTVTNLDELETVDRFVMGKPNTPDPYSSRSDDEEYFISHSICADCRKMLPGKVQPALVEPMNQPVEMTGVDPKPAEEYDFICPKCKTHTIYKEKDPEWRTVMLTNETLNKLNILPYKLTADPSAFCSKCGKGREKLINVTIACVKCGKKFSWICTEADRQQIDMLTNKPRPDGSSNIMNNQPLVDYINSRVFCPKCLEKIRQTKR